MKFLFLSLLKLIFLTYTDYSSLKNNEMEIKSLLYVVYKSLGKLSSLPPKRSYSFSKLKSFLIF